MSLAVFNGSPRGKSSNSSVITGWFTAHSSHEVSVYYLNKFKERDSQIEAFLQADQILMVFPLYVDGMPGQVKAFFEALTTHKDQLISKPITFIIHSGFSEGIQSRALEAYLVRISAILDLNNHGVIIVPGSEGFRLMPEAMTRKKADYIGELGKAFFDGRPYESALLKKVTGHETMNKRDRMLFSIMNKLGLTNMYWNQNLKKNHAYDERFAAPYENKPTQITTSAYLKNF